jgi:hypothetical protein
MPWGTEAGELIGIMALDEMLSAEATGKSLVRTGAALPGDRIVVRRSLLPACAA